MLPIQGALVQSLVGELDPTWMPQLRPGTDKINKFKKKKRTVLGNSLAIQWLGLSTSTAGGMGSIPGRGTKIPHAAQHGQKNDKVLSWAHV